MAAQNSQFLVSIVGGGETLAVASYPDRFVAEKEALEQSIHFKGYVDVYAPDGRLLSKFIDGARQTERS